MKINKLLLATLCGFGVTMSMSSIVSAAGTTDNEILLDQQGTTLTLTIDQQGYGNKVAGDTSSATDFLITGGTVTFNLDQVGNLNKFFGPLISDNATINAVFTGDSNVWDWDLGASGSTDYANFLVDVTGDSNTFDIDVGGSVAAERLDFDLDILGSSNVFTSVDIESDDAVWDFDITGSNSTWTTSQSDGAYHKIYVLHNGSNAAYSLTQSSGTCATGITSCYSEMNLDVNSENATITITQTD
jgi:hypothetical protein|tara:strand:+ start:15260 stop:15991 length:732 start_codon:yes stop_codon:yes gene_type:complete